MTLKEVSSKFSFAGRSDIGLVRSRNEDVWGVLEEAHFFALADGMGGHQAGDVASREALGHMMSVCQALLAGPEKTLIETSELIKTAVGEVNSHLYQFSKSSPQYFGMGTTLISLLFHSEGAIMAHVGDSRIYRMREGQCQLLTKDHSLFREMVDLGRVGEIWPSDFSYKNILTKAVGTDPRVVPTVTFCDYQRDDQFLLCSDGLTDALIAEQIGEILKEKLNLEEKVKKLIQEAKNGGSQDNITVVLIQVNDLSR
jgi:PPM family protein phosphatase